MRVLRWSWPVFAVALLFIVPRGCHALRPERALNVVVVSKTVPFENRIEHRSLFWLLDHRKIVKPVIVNVAYGKLTTKIRTTLAFRDDQRG